MECISIDSVAAFGPGDSGSNPELFAVLNSNKKLSLMNNTLMWYYSKYCNPAMEYTLVEGDKYPLKDALGNLEMICGPL